MGGSKSSSNTSSTSNNTDGRVAADNGGIGVSSQGPVHLNVVADEAFELGEVAIRRTLDSADNIAELGFQNNKLLADHLTKGSTAIVGTLSEALVATQEAGKSEAGQISEQLIRIGIPAAALAFAVAAIARGGK